MKAIVLAGGFAKRMWPLTKDKPKHLLPIAGRPMLEYVLDKAVAVSGVDHVYVSTNAKFKSDFEKFLGGYIGCPAHITIELVIEDTFSEGEKLGSVGALGYLIREKKIESDLLIIGGDNLFDFNVNDIKDYYEDKQNNVMVVYDVEEMELAKLYGIVTLNESGKIIKFHEKPSEPESTLASTACYFFKPAGVAKILQYIDEGNSADALGHFIEWLIERTDVYGFVHKGSWFDIGSLESYDEANKFYKNKS